MTSSHADDIRRALDREVSPPPPEVLHRMADLSVTTMPASLEMVERANRGKTARVVLTGEGGGDWPIPLGFSPTAESSDVIITAESSGGAG